MNMNKRDSGKKRKTSLATKFYLNLQVGFIQHKDEVIEVDLVGFPYFGHAADFDEAHVDQLVDIVFDTYCHLYRGVYKENEV